MFVLDYGPAVIEHALLESGFTSNVKVNKILKVENVMVALKLADDIMKDAKNTPSKVPILKINKKYTIKYLLPT